MRKFLTAFGPLLFIAGVAAFTPHMPAGAAQAMPSKAQWGTFGVDFASMDRSVHPGDDPWSFVNGTWAKTSEIPADRGSLSQVARLNDLASSQVKAIVEDNDAARLS